ncbi:hypothetical protein B9G79_03525 [Bdellovibrio bacteriovorus]|uniref:Uncharacterized protein n=1 Tax=Bdellovibrio bacteriovorus TaxID=959 RepID=A0A1Z3N5F0_BDEBC|nr:hypothetical protein B9G79_03525 [Bdellovibrio bacteriovorus]
MPYEFLFRSLIFDFRAGFYNFGAKKRHLAPRKVPDMRWRRGWEIWGFWGLADGEFPFRLKDMFEGSRS